MKTSMTKFRWLLVVTYSDGSSKSAAVPNKIGAEAFKTLLEKQPDVVKCEIKKSARP